MTAMIKKNHMKIISSFPPEFTSDLLDIHAEGCIEESACRNETGQILTVNFTITRTCCSTDLCNGAAPIQMPLTAALCAALVAVWSQWSL